MKKVLALILIMVCALTCVLAGCDGQFTMDKLKNPQTVMHTIALQSATALQSAQAMDVLPQTNETNEAVVETNQTLEQNGETSIENVEPVAENNQDAQIDATQPDTSNVEVDNSLANKILDIIPNADLISAYSSKLVVTDSDKEGYKYKVELNYGLVDCVVYLEEVIKNEEVDKDEDEDEEEEEEEEIEISNEYKGMILFNGNEYIFKGETKLEKEGDEVEEELTLKIFINKNTYIFINQEFEKETGEEEESFKYRFYVDGDLVEEYKISREVEGEKGELKIKKNGEEFKYKYYVKDEVEYIQIINDTLTEVYQKILNADGTYSYVEEPLNE